MEFKQLQSLIAVVDCKSFTKAAEKLYISQPTISAHIRSLEEELNSRLMIRTTKSIEITPHGLELYECASTMLGLCDNLIQRWQPGGNQVIQLGASTIPSAYILPEILPKYGELHPDIYFSIHQGDSQDVIQGILNHSYDIGMAGMECEDDALDYLPFYRDRMVLVTPVNSHFLALKQQGEDVIQTILREPLILRERGSGSRKTADVFLESIGIKEEDLQVSARINDQEAIKNFVVGGLGVSIVSEIATRDLAAEKRLLVFELPEYTARRNLYLVTRKNYILKPCIQKFLEFTKNYYH